MNVSRNSGHRFLGDKVKGGHTPTRPQRIVKITPEMLEKGGLFFSDGKPLDNNTKQVKKDYFG